MDNIEKAKVRLSVGDNAPDLNWRDVIKTTRTVAIRSSKETDKRLEEFINNPDKFDHSLKHGKSS